MHYSRHKTKSSLIFHMWQVYNMIEDKKIIRYNFFASETSSFHISCVENINATHHQLSLIRNCRFIEKFIAASKNK
jgi:hypothetical protein